MDDLNNIYNELIMEHSMNSYNKKKLKKADLCDIGHNPNCGDEITLEVKMNGDVIEDMAFSGHGCAISQASTSIMIDTLKGKTIEEAKDIIKTFISMIKREETLFRLRDVLFTSLLFSSLWLSVFLIPLAILRQELKIIEAESTSPRKNKVAKYLFESLFIYLP